jgi:hypothetical protein
MKTYTKNQLSKSIFRFWIIILMLFYGISYMHAQDTEAEKKAKLERLKELKFRLSNTRGTYDYATSSTPMLHGYGSGNANHMNHFNGVYTTSIPIADGIDISYASNGILVNQVASWVGLGWDLNVGGKISRSVHGYPDDIWLINQRFDNSDDKYHFFGWLKDYDGSTPAELVYNFNTSGDLDYRSEKIEQFLGNVESGSVGNYDFDKIDSEPDHFYYNFPGNSGSFVFTEQDNTTNQKKVAFIPYKNLEVEYSLNFYPQYIESITVRDQNGAQYIFSELERVVTNAGLYPAANREPLHEYDFPQFISGSFSGHQTISLEDGYVQSWFLSKIIYPNKREIIFEYEDEVILLEPGYYMNYRDYTNNADEPLSQIVRNYPYNELPDYENYPDAVLMTKRLKKITGDDFEIELIADQKREDLNYDDNTTSPKALNKIKVYSKVDGTKTLTKEVNFYYSYFDSYYNHGQQDDNKGYAIFCPDDNEDVEYGSYIYKRLKLDEIQVYNGSEFLPPYQFEYIQDDEGEYWLPARYSYCQDFWGYYKESSTEQSLVPKTYVYPNREGQYRFSVYDLSSSSPGTSPEYILPGANRTPEEDYIDIGMLNRINYPTGAYTEFEYEPNDFFIDNDFFSGGGVRISEIRTGGSDVDNSITEYNYSPGKLISIPLFGHLDPVNSICSTLDPDSYSTWDQNDFNFYYVRGTANENDMSEGSLGYSWVEEVNDGISGKTVYYFNNDATYNSYTNIDYPEYEMTSAVVTPSRVDYLTSEEMYDPPLPIPYNLTGIDFDNGAYPFSTNTNYNWHRGKPEKKEVIDANNLTVLNTEYQYDWFYADNNAPNIVYGLKNSYLMNNIPPRDVTCPNYNDIEEGEYNYLFRPLTMSSKYKIHTNMTSFVGQENNTYAIDANTTISDQTDLEYNHKGYISKSTYINAQGDEISTEYIYLCDLWPESVPIPSSNQVEDSKTQAVFNLLEKNVDGLPVQVISYKKNFGESTKYLTGSTISVYKPITINSLNETIEPLYQTYSLINNGNLSLNDIDYVTILDNSNYKYELIIDDSNYELNLSSTTYDEKGNLLEAISENNPPKAYIYDKDKTQIIAEAQNAKSRELAYANFDNHDTENWSASGNVTTVDYSGTKSGSIAAKIRTGFLSTSLSIPSDAKITGFKASVWAKGYIGKGYLSVTINNTLFNESVQITKNNEWELLTIDIAPADLESISFPYNVIVKVGNATTSYSYFDDIIFRPSDAVFTGYTYNNKRELTSVCDDNGMYTYLEYDDLGRSTVAYDNDRNILEANEYFIGDPCDFSFHPQNASQIVVTAGQSTTFLPNVTSGTNAKFNFGDNTNDVTANGAVNHTFTSAGTYNVKLSMILEGTYYQRYRLITVLPANN